jgi:2-(1,2-epoxy-1,2-dihydrophenyl)acetyl-CoA isomerase
VAADPVLVAQGKGVTRLTLNRADKLNAFNEAMHVALREGLEAARGNGARAVLLTGAGKGFCAGQDLGDRLAGAEGPPDLGATLDGYYNPLVRLIRELPVPVVCAVNGVAAGAGANIALACDIVLAARSARFIEAFSRIGLIPDSGGTWFLPRLVGESRARGLEFLGEPIDAETAQSWGLIWKAVDDELLDEEATALAEQLAAGPTHGYALLKRAFNASVDNTLDAQLDLERDLQAEAGRTPDYAEGVRAFMEKRKPSFTGKA